MTVRLVPRLVFFTLIGLILFSMVSAIAATNSVPPSRLTDQRRFITANDRKPPECAALNLTAIVVGSGNFKGTLANELILGGPDADTIDARPGDDCILGGGGDDFITGSEGADVCIGGPGDDTLVNCAVCIGGPGDDKFSNCLIEIP